MTTKLELIDEIAKKTGLRKTDAEKALNACLNTIKESFAKEKNVTLRGFGSFATVKKKERKARNPNTGEKMIIPAKKVVKFVPSKILQDDLTS